MCSVIVSLIKNLTATIHNYAYQYNQCQIRKITFLVKALISSLNIEILSFV